MRVERDRTLEKHPSLGVVSSEVLVSEWQAQVIEAPCFEVLGSALSCAEGLYTTHVTNDRRRDGAADLILEHEHVLNFAVVGSRPNVLAGGCIDKLHCDANTITR